MSCLGLLRISGPIENCFCEIPRRAKIKFGKITNDDELWDYVSDMVMEDDFTQFIKRYYDNFWDIWE
jgi:hypothetical protein